MKAPRLFILLILAVFCCQKSYAQIAPTEKRRIERLAGLAKVWGAVKYFHPYPADREIDWDKALVETIPQVNAAKSPEEYNTAINHLLLFLNDKETFAQIADPNEAKSLPTDNTEFFHVKDNVLIIDAVKIAEAGAIDQSAVSRIFPPISAALSNAKAVVFDCRSNYALKDSGAVFEYFFDGILRAILTQISDKPIRLGSTRYRIQNGYAPQTGITSGGYYSGFINIPAQSLIGQSKVPMPPVVVVYNEKTPAGSPIFTALQATENVLTVEEGAAAQVIGGGSTVLKLPEGVSVRMRTTENINADGSIGFLPDIAVPKKNGADEALDEALKNIAANTLTRPKNKSVQTTSTLLYGKDATYTEMKYPSAEYRLLALFRFWNAINYFYPYKDLIGGDWRDVLPEYIPKLEAAKDAAEYQLTIREMAAQIHDSHGAVRNVGASDEKIGLYFPPVVVRYIENQTVVAKVLEENLPVNAGDVILAVDGEPVEKRREYLSRFFAASTAQSLMRSVHAGLLRGQKDSAVKLKIRGADGKIRDVEINRSFAANNPKFAAANARSGEAARILPEGFGYVDLQRLTIPEVGKMFEMFKNTPAIIFDMRGYPQGTAGEIASHLNERKNVVAALFSRPLLEASDFSEDENSITPSYTFEQKLPAPKSEIYKGKVVVLIDETAISQAEHLCLFLEAARPDATFVGMPTTGANGDVTSVILPGNISINFTGQSVRHADGSGLQRIGIQPTVKAVPTIRGIIDNRDEILEAAIKFLKAK